ncbi:MAG: threonine synthase, partial [Rhodobacterales bacterium]|nr:threonine synthase [Rhodobacterales bacterium]
MKYVSTRGKAPDLNFEEAMLTGLARDGGLYVPEEYPLLSVQQISSFSTKSYEEVAFEIMKPFIGDTFSDDEFKRIIKTAYSGFSHRAKCPMVQLSEN